MRHITRHGMYALFGLAALAVILPAGGGPAFAQTTADFYVDVEFTGGEEGDGSSWSTPFIHLQCALAAASASDEIWAAGGTYYPDEGAGVTPGDQTASFVLLNGMKLYGGYRGYSGLPNNADVRDETSILSGDIDGNGTLDADNSQHVVTASGLTSDTLLDRFTVTFGYADGTTGLAKNAGAILVSDCSDFTIANCTIENNYAQRGAGAVYVVLQSAGPISSETTIKNCEFNDNEAEHNGGAVFFDNDDNEDGHNLTVTDTVFNRNNSLVEAAGALATRGADKIVITDCDFNDNFAFLYGGALELRDEPEAIATAVTTITRCTFTGNGIKSGEPETITGVGGAVRIDAARKTDFIDCTFTGNKCEGSGGGAIWAEAPQSANVEFNLTDCTFLRNEMIVDSENAGGGALWVEGTDSPQGPEEDGVIHGTWSGCTFIENKGFKGGAAYLTSTALVEIEDCKFISNHSSKGGGAICVSDMEDITTTELRICNSDFIANTADTKGGAVYNRGGSTTTMVNCIVAGNTADSLGGGTCNADDFADPAAPTVFNLHNCLLAGNLADTTGNQGGGHLNRDDGVSTLINCTVVLNEAFDVYGGTENVSDAGVLTVQNCIVWGNDDSGSSVIDNQLHFSSADPADLEVDQNVIEDCSGACFPGTGNANIGTDPDAVNNIASPTWTECTYDADTGITTFDVTSVSTLTNESLFRPDNTLPLQLLIKEVDTVDDLIICYGKWSDHGLQQKTGTIYDYHIATGSSAIDYGDTNHLPLDLCDLDGDGKTTTEDLSRDLDVTNNREIGNAPESGAYEIE